jgi:osmotically-inducible protein OsmY
MPANRFAAAIVLLSVLAVVGCKSPTLIVLEDPRSFIEERSLLVSREDARIKLDIQSLYIEHAIGKLSDVTVEVYEGAVMLTGIVAEEADKERSGELASQAEGSGLVYNEVQVAGGASLRDAAADLALETRIKKVLRAAEGIHSVNMRWHSVNAIVYMFGRALSEEERVKAVELSSAVVGVKKIVDRMKVKPVEE